MLVVAFICHPSQENDHVTCSVAEVPNFTHAVFLNLPADEADPARIKTHYVGSLNFFGKDSNHGGKPHHDHAEGKAPVETFGSWLDCKRPITGTPKPSA